MKFFLLSRRRPIGRAKTGPPGAELFFFCSKVALEGSFTTASLPLQSSRDGETNRTVLSFPRLGMFIPGTSASWLMAALSCSKNAACLFSSCFASSFAVSEPPLSPTLEIFHVNFPLQGRLLPHDLRSAPTPPSPPLPTLFSH